MKDVLLSEGTVYGLSRCPHCGVATPLIVQKGDVTKHYKDGAGNTQWYFDGQCSRCKHMILFYGYTSAGNTPANDVGPRHVVVEKSYPELASVAEELPAQALRFLQQALESKHAPDGAVMLAASSIDAMLKDQGYKEDGSLYSRITAATSDSLLTEGMSAWAHEIRLSANEPRHADEDFVGATPEDAEQILAFARALGEYLYVLPARVAKWQAKASEGVNVKA